MITFEITGLAGFLPQSPHTYRNAWRNREELRLAQFTKKKKEEIDDN